jgi:homopolymeric O-antigen transport system permease protein
VLSFVRSASLSAVERVLAPFRTLLVHRNIIRALVRRDIRGRYVASTIGFSWAVIQPLALLGLYTFVFSGILNVRLGPGAATADFALYLFCGMLPWLAFADGLTRSASVIIDETPMIKKVVFPSEVLPASAVLSALVMEFVGLACLLCVVLVSRGVGWPLTVLPVVIVLQFLFTLGLGWFLASVTVFVRDVRHLLGLALTLWMFLTPILYPESLVPARFRWLLDVNPMRYVVGAYRSLVLEQRVPPASDVLTLAVVAVVVAVAGHTVFQRSKQVFADVL